MKLNNTKIKLKLCEERVNCRSVKKTINDLDLEMNSRNFTTPVCNRNEGIDDNWPCVYSGCSVKH